MILWKRLKRGGPKKIEEGQPVIAHRRYPGFGIFKDYRKVYLNVIAGEYELELTEEDAVRLRDSLVKQFPLNVTCNQQ